MAETQGRPNVEVVIGEVIESVFKTVAEVRRLALACHDAAAAHGGRLADDDVRGLAPEILTLLRKPDEIAVGLGLILEPGLLPAHPLRIEWWQWAAGHDNPVQLEVDLHPDSLGFYDYASTEWFAVPKGTRQRHIVGPYVDVHGTDQYLLTLTMPVEADGEFLGVAGADVPITRFETLVLRRLEPGGEAVIVNGEGRVVLSTSSRWITGSLVGKGDAVVTRALPRLPWELFEPMGSGRA